MRNVLVAVSVCLLSVINAVAQWTAPGTGGATTPTHYDGNVGIGTGATTPPHRLTVFGGHVALDNGMQVIGHSGTNGLYFRLIGNDSSNRILLGDTTGGISSEIRFHSNSTSIPTVLITTSGSVGIGTGVAAPASKLQVEDLNNNADFLLDAGDVPGVPNSPTMTIMRKDGNHAQLAKYGFTLDANDSNKLKILYGTTSTFTATPLVIDTTGNVGIGLTAPAYRLDVTGGGHFSGALVVDGNLAAKYQDVAEWVPAAEEMPAGTVVVVSGTTANTVGPSQHAYDTRVAGVVSAQPGLTLGEGSSTKAKIATTGRVKVRVDATKHAIAMGDLLVTSDVSGAAMFSEPLDLGGVKIHRPGTLIGKALEPLPSGEGEILVLLSLQ